MTGSAGRIRAGLMHKDYRSPFLALANALR